MHGRKYVVSRGYWAKLTKFSCGGFYLLSANIAYRGVPLGLEGFFPWPLAPQSPEATLPGSP